MAEFDPVAENPNLANALAKEGFTPEAEKDEGPSYRIIGTASKIPVSKSLGKVWQSRIDQARNARRDSEEAWKEAIRYYENDQSQHRTSNEDASGAKPSRRIGRGWMETENIVFSNTTTMLPMLYAKNPEVEITPTNEEVNQAWAVACEALINKLFAMGTSPGVDLKPTVRRGVLWTMLTNSGYSKVNWTKKDDSSEKALADLREISDRYAKAKTAKEIKEAEGELQALEERISLLTPSGPTVGLVSPFRLFIDPTSVKGDHSDARWIAEEDYLPTYYLNAVYGKKVEGKIVSLYEPSHVLKAGGTGDNGVTELEDEINNFSLFSKSTDREKTAQKYGYNNTAAFDKAQYTQVFWIWDKITRRLFLYACNKWDWPLWVWDDPLKLQEFYPYDHLWFHESVESPQPKGEVTYYLDQQDRINDNNATLAQARDWTKNNIFFDQNKTNQQQVQLYLKGPNGTAVGIDVPEGGKITDVIFSLPPPALAYPDLLNNASAYEAINKITGISAAQQGAQFKTNTTNDAVNFYQKNVDIRVDEKIDCIEDWIGKIGWKLIQICAQNYTVQDVADIIGAEKAKGWQQVSDLDLLRKSLNLRVVGGSTDKPTSKNKKRQALEVAQVMGQFGNGIPAIAIVALKVLSRAFSDDVVVSQADWSMIFQSLNDQANAAGGGPSAAQGGAPSGEVGAEGADQSSVVQEQIAGLIKQLPPQMQGQLQGMIDEGVPPKEALETIMAQAQQQQQ